VSNAINMNRLFSLTPISVLEPSISNDFNQNISQWDTSSVESMSSMFEGEELFDNYIGSWDVSKVTECENFKEGALLLTDVYTPNFQNCALVPAHHS
jgi:hypothetical protein